MAEAPKPQRPRRRRRRNSETKVELKVVESELIDGQPSKPKRARRRRRQRRPVFGPWLPGQKPPRASRIRKIVKKEIKREGLDGPRVSVQQRVSSTFGLVGPNQSGNVEMELNFFLHPSLAKEANDGTSFGPVQALAAQYALWKLKYLRLIFTPMVGASAVSGTVIRASLNLSQSPGGTNWSGLGTRIHLDLHPGQKAVFNLRGDQIGGPRDGGWWLTDTNEEGTQSAGPIVEVHTLGKTVSTFKDQEWIGPLFIVEGIGVWQFANYQVKPALGMLERRQGDADVTVTATAGQPITMELSNSNAIAQFMMDAEPELTAVTSTSSVGETIFQIVDVGAEIAAVFAPQPFGWLIAGGWWFLKRAFTPSRQIDGVVFNVYPSLSDAQSNRPAIAGVSTALKTKASKVNLIVTQMNAPNVGPQPTPAAFTRAAVPIPMQVGNFRMHAEMFPEEVVSWVDEEIYYPNSYVIGDFQEDTRSTKWLKTSWYVARDLGSTVQSQKPSQNGGYIHTLYVLHHLRFSTPDGSTEFIPPEPKSGAALYYGSSAETQQNVYNKVGEVVATAHISENTTSNFLGMVFTLIKTTSSLPGQKQTRNRAIVWATQAGTDAARRDKIQFTSFTNTSSLPVHVHNVGFSNGDYLLGVSYAVGSDAAVPGGISKIPGTNVDVSVNFPFNHTGPGAVSDAYMRMDAFNGMIPQDAMRIVPYVLAGNIFAVPSIDLRLNYVDTADQDLLERLRALGVSFNPEVPLALPTEDLTPEYLREFLHLLADEGRLPNRSEIAMRAGNYREALAIYRSENPL